MNASHLSAWEIEELIIGAAEDAPRGRSGDEAREHIRDCEICRSNQERLQDTLLLYRDAALIQTQLLARSHSDDDSTLAFVTAKGINSRVSSHSSRRWLWGWSLALLVLMTVLAPIFVRHQRERHEAELARDNLLLEQVDQAVAESVPYPLQSLTKLVVASEDQKESAAER